MVRRDNPKRLRSIEVRLGWDILKLQNALFIICLIIGILVKTGDKKWYF